MSAICTQSLFGNEEASFVGDSTRWSELTQAEKETAGVGVDPLLEEKLKCCGNDSIDKERYVALPCRCRSRFCSDCAESLGIKLRERLRPRVAEYHCCFMVTLTVDPTLFSGAKAAWEYVREKRCVGEFVKELARRGRLKGRQWFCVIEFHKNGFPHWHLLLDATRIEHREMMEIWGRFRPRSAPATPEAGRPAFGFVAFSKRDFESSDHAAHYATKYVIKTPEGGWPDWVLDHRGRVVRYSVSRGFWGEGPQADNDGEAVDSEGEGTEQRCDVEPVDEEEYDEQEQLPRSIRERLRQCGRGTVICRQRYDINEAGKAIEKFEFVTAIATEFWSVQRAYGVKGRAVYLKRHEMLDLVDQAKQEEAAQPPERIGAFDDWNSACDAHERARHEWINRKLPEWLQTW